MGARLWCLHCGVEHDLPAHGDDLGPSCVSCGSHQFSTVTRLGTTLPQFTENDRRFLRSCRIAPGDEVVQLE
jgi:hypothetical protein